MGGEGKGGGGGDHYYYYIGIYCKYIKGQTQIIDKNLIHKISGKGTKISLQKECVFKTIV